MLENCIIYTVEIIKYYIIMKCLLGFKVRRNIALSIVGVIIIGIFSVYVTLTENNPMAMFLVYIFCEMFLLIREKITTIALATCWLMIIVGMIDGMFLVVIEFVAYNFNIAHSILDCIASVVALLFLWLLVCVVKKRTKGENFKIPKVYYVYFSLLTLAEGVLITVMENVLREEYGLKMLLLIIGCTMVMMMNIVIVLCLAVANDGYKQRDELNRKYLKIQEENYIYLKERNEDVRKFRHDMKGHMLVVKELLNENKKEQLESYINSVEKNIHLGDKRVSVANGIVDAIINKYLHEANKFSVEMVVEGQMYEDNIIEPYDLCVIFDNILKNALEAAMKSIDGKIYLRINRDKKYIQVYIENSYVGNRIKKGEEYVTTKKEENHGYGLKNVNNSVKKYNGTVSINMNRDLFCIDIFIPNYM